MNDTDPAPPRRGRSPGVDLLLVALALALLVLATAVVLYLASHPPGYD